MAAAVRTPAWFNTPNCKSALKPQKWLPKNFGVFSYFSIKMVLKAILSVSKDWCCNPPPYATYIFSAPPLIGLSEIYSTTHKLPESLMNNLTTFLIQDLHFFLEYFLLNHRYQNVDFVGFWYANRMEMNVRLGKKSAKNTHIRN